MSETIYLGIDPSLRHTGLCLLKEGEASRFFEITTGDECVFRALEGIKRAMQRILVENTVYGGPMIVGIERQLPTSGVLFCSMMAIIETLKTWGMVLNPWAVMPLPIQLKSYMKKSLRMDVSTKMSVVIGVRRLVSEYTRLSSHKADAYCLARMARAVSQGEWVLRLPEKETRLLPEQMVFGTKG